MGRCPSCGSSEHLVLMSGAGRVTLYCDYPCTCLTDGGDSRAQHSVRHSLKERMTMNLITLGGSQGLEPREDLQVLWSGLFWPKLLPTLTTFTEHMLCALYTHHGIARPQSLSPSLPHFATSLGGRNPTCSEEASLDWFKNRLFRELLLHLPQDMGTGLNSSSSTAPPAFQGPVSDLKPLFLPN